MKKITTLFFLIFKFSIFCQNIQRQMLSSQGNSIVVSNRMYISQSIGQQSVNGTSQKNNVILSQGYQQSLWNIYIKTHDTSLISTTTYPNPFFDTVNFQFSQPIITPVQITIFDITGKIIFQKTQLPNETVLTLSNLQLPYANYLVRLTAEKFNYYTKIIQSK